MQTFDQRADVRTPVLVGITLFVCMFVAMSGVFGALAAAGLSAFVAVIARQRSGDSFWTWLPATFAAVFAIVAVVAAV